MDNNKNNAKMPDIPLGLGMSMSQNPEALSYFGQLSNTQKSKVINYVQSSDSGDDALGRVKNAVESMNKQDSSFLG